MLKRLFRPFGLIPMSEYDVVYRWYEEKRNECQAWETRVEVLTSERDDLSDRLMALKEDVEKLEVERDLALEEIVRKTGEIRMLGDKLALANASNEHLSILASSAPEEVKQERRKKTREVPHG